MKAFFLRHVDVNTAWKAALFLGLIVYAINFSHGAMAALPAALKQAMYTFFVAGFILRLCEKLSVDSSLGMMALPLAVLIPSSIAIGLTYLMHSLKGTPEPFYSTVPTILMSFPSFGIWAWRSQKTLGEHSV
jgi:hypothetical protein